MKCQIKIIIYVNEKKTCYDIVEMALLDLKLRHNERGDEPTAVEKAVDIAVIERLSRCIVHDGGV